MKKTAVALVFLAFLATGCTQGHSYPDTYRSVEELRDAFVEAGGDCPEWDQTNAVTASSESGTCSTTTVLSIYSSTSDRDVVVDNIRAMAEVIGGANLLVGENWIINDPNVADLDPEMGGTLFTKSS